MVLVIEDDPAMGGMLSQLLHAAGHSVTVAQSGTDALELLSAANFELILLDLMLPDSDGLMLISRLRALTGSPIVVCSARSSQVDRVIALKIGADDFISKPFDLDELEARIIAVLRRSQGKQLAAADRAPAELRVGELVVAPSRGAATIGSQSLQLTPTEYRLLLHLASHAGEVLSRRELAGALWGYVDRGTDHMIDVHMGRLRRKIREAGGEQMIATVHGAGYRLTLPGPEPSACAST